MKFIRKNKGQVSAPFELLVAVVIMAFVVIVGWKVLTDAKLQSCLNTVDKSMTDFKINLEDTANRRSENFFNFSPDRTCFYSKDSAMKIYLEKSSSVCAAICKRPVQECYVLKFANQSIPNAAKNKCLELPTYTSFTASGDLCTNIDQTLYRGYEPVNPLGDDGDNLGIGQYVFKYVALQGQAFPQICIWFRPSG